MGDGDTPARDPASEGAEKLETEIGWYLRRIVVLFRGWTTPLNSPAVNTFTKDDGVSARAFALLLIVALVFAIRGEPSSGAAAGDTVKGVTLTGLAAGLAVLLSVLLNLASKGLGVTVGERVILSAYASTILVMFGYVVLVTVGPNYDTYLLWQDYLGPVLLPVLLASVCIFLLLLLKSTLLDKERIGTVALLHGLLLTIGSGMIVWLVARMSGTTFAALLTCLKNPSLQCVSG
jgi:hypothetical protein